MKNLFLIFVGGGLGSVARFWISKSLQNSESAIPYGTFSVNIIGSFIIGLVLAYVASTTNNLSESLGFLLAVGFCGGFTTFSSFAFENLNLLRSGAILEFGIYTVGSILLSLAAVLLAVWLGELSFR